MIIQFLRPRNTKRGNHIVKRYIRQKPCFLRTSITFTTVPYGASIVALTLTDPPSRRRDGGFPS